jgi:predicted PhzF superfamily epimerase YddE/YHI9
VQIATGLNASTPVMLDQYTRLEEATVTPDNVFRYHYSVVNTNNPDSLLENMSQALVKNMKTAFSTNADLRIFTENNVVIEYIYTDENNNNIRTLRINPEDYK